MVRDQHKIISEQQITESIMRLKESQVGKTCLVSELLDELENGGNLDEDAIRNLARSAFGGLFTVR